MKMHSMRILTFALAALLLTACDQLNTLLAPASPEKSVPAEKEAKAVKNGLVKTHRPDGTLSAEVNYKDGTKHGLMRNYSKDGKKLLSELEYKNGRITGLAKNYYPTGKVSNEFSYVNDTLHGDSKWFYENGSLYQLTPHEHGKKSGVQKTYDRKGTLISEVPYYQGEVAKGTREYTSTGELKPLPEITFEPIDRILKDNTFILRAYLSDHSSKARFYVGKLSGGKYLGDELVWHPSTGGVVELRYYVPPGSFAMEKINVVVSSKTKAGNPFITEKSYNLAVDNKGI